MKRSMDSIRIAQRRLQTTTAIKVNVPGKVGQFEFYVYGLKRLCGPIRQYGIQESTKITLNAVYEMALYK